MGSKEILLESRMLISKSFGYGERPNEKTTNEGFIISSHHFFHLFYTASHQTLFSGTCGFS